MKKLIFVVFLALILCSTLLFGSVIQASTVEGWQIENGGGTYSESNGILTLSGGIGNKNIAFYREVVPATDFSFSLQVKSTTLAGFVIFLKSSLPIANTVNGVNFEFDNRNGGCFLLARWTNSWTWNIFASAQENVWYTMIINVQQSPFKITAQVLDENGNSLGSNSVSDMTNFSFESIKYLAFCVYESGTYSVRNIYNSLEPQTPTPTPTPTPNLTTIPPIVEWSKTYSGATAVDHWPYFVIQTIDGGYAIAGRTALSGSGNYAFWLIKTDSTGNMQWNKTYGGSNLLLNMIQTKDGGFALIGNKDSENTAWIIKTDAYGNMQWNKTYGGGSRDSPYSIVETSDGYVFAGYTMSFGAGGWDMWLVKTDIHGNPLWTKTFGGGSADGATDFIQTNDGGYALFGSTWSFASRSADWWLVKTNAEGIAQWNKTYDGKGWDNSREIVQTSDGGYAMFGDTAQGELGPNVDFWLVRTDENGNALWNKTYGGAGDEWGGFGLVRSNEGGFAFVGRTNSFGGGGNDFWFVKTDLNGNMQWNKTFGGTGDDVGTSVVQTNDA